MHECRMSYSQGNPNMKVKIPILSQVIFKNKNPYGKFQRRERDRETGGRGEVREGGRISLRSHSY